MVNYVEKILFMVERNLQKLKKSGLHYNYLRKAYAFNNKRLTNKGAMTCKQSNYVDEFCFIESHHLLLIHTSRLCALAETKLLF